MNAFLDVARIAKSERDLKVLNETSFTVAEGQHTAIMGATGSGKTTLLRILAGWASPSTGQVHFLNSRIRRIPEEKLVPGHPGIAYLDQQFTLPGFLTVAQVLEYANTMLVAEAENLYRICRIGHLLGRRTDQLSGGEKQRIAIARLLSTRPRLLLLDEPFSNLDTIHKEALREILASIGRELGITTVMVAHDPLDTLSWAAQVLVMHQGTVVQRGTPQQVYYQPVNEYVAALGGPYNIIRAQMAPELPRRWQSFLEASGVSMTTDQALLIRPEFLAMHPAGDGDFSIASKKFYGRFFEFVVTCGPIRLLVRTLSESCLPGQQVHVFPSTSALHILQSPN